MRAASGNRNPWPCDRASCRSWTSPLFLHATMHSSLFIGSNLRQRHGVPANRGLNFPNSNFKQRRHTSAMATATVAPLPPRSGGGGGGGGGGLCKTQNTGKAHETA